MDNSPEDISDVFNLIMAGFGSQVVRAMSVLSIAEHLQDESLSADQIADRASTQPRATFRLLRAGVALGLVTFDPSSRTFSSTSRLRVLHADSDSSLKHYARAAAGDLFWLPALRLSDAVRDGEPQTEATFGVDTFGYLGTHPQAAREFSLAMTGLSAPVVRIAATVIDIGTAGTVVDVGGAEGSFAAELLTEHPHLCATVLELPQSSHEIEREAQKRGLVGRLRAEIGDFFEAVPVGDVYLLKFILHDWADEAATRILTRIREAMPRDGRVFVVEMLADETDVPHGLALMDMGMLCALGGTERTLEEYDRLFEAADLQRTRVIQLLAPYAAIEVRHRSRR